MKFQGAGIPHPWENEAQLFRFWDSLSSAQRDSLEYQLSSIRQDTLDEQRLLVKKDQEIAEKQFECIRQLNFSGNETNQEAGQKKIAQGQLGCLLLAGGQGTRLQWKGPKGTYPISVIKKKSLFQLCAEKVKAAGLKAGRALDLAIMTSEENNRETQSFFQQHAYFGLDPSQISFFVQEGFPLLDKHGKLFLQKPWEVAMGPNGNGESLLHFAKSGILDRWVQKGVEYLHVILVDNPLADPFDAELLGFHCQKDSDITLKCTEKGYPEEKVGVLVEYDGKYQVVEYSEMSTYEKNARREDGRLKHCCANLSMFCFSLSFIRRIVAENRRLPLHKALKSAQFVDERGDVEMSEMPFAWKFETFIFDWLLYTSKVDALIYPREQCFAPLKNLNGSDSPDTVRFSLQAADKKVIQSITGRPPPDFPFELSAEFYYPSQKLLSKWKGKEVLDSYVNG